MQSFQTTAVAAMVWELLKAITIIREWQKCDNINVHFLMFIWLMLICANYDIYILVAIVFLNSPRYDPPKKIGKSIKNNNIPPRMVINHFSASFLVA